MVSWHQPLLAGSLFEWDMAYGSALHYHQPAAFAFQQELYGPVAELSG